MDYSKILSASGSVVTLFIILIIGYIARFIGIIDEKTTKKLSLFLLYICNPLMIISSFQLEYNKELLARGLSIAAASIVMHISATLLAKALFKNKSRSKDNVIFKFCFVFANCGFLGFPVLKAYFSDTAVFYGAFFTLVFNAYIWTYGILVLRHKEKGAVLNPLKVFINPGTVSTLIGLVLFLLPFRLPGIVFNAMNSIGDFTFPLSMIIIGSMIKNAPKKSLFLTQDMFLYSVAKLLIFPILTLIVCLILKATINLSEGYVYFCVIMAAMPGAAIAPIFADKYNRNSLLATGCVVVSTVLSVFSIPIVLFVTTLCMNI